MKNVPPGVAAIMRHREKLPPGQQPIAPPMGAGMPPPAQGNPMPPAYGMPIDKRRKPTYIRK